MSEVEGAGCAEIGLRPVSSAGETGRKLISARGAAG
jgi:hypothetical protein